MIKLIITDLDDTLYSWIGFFIPAFYAMAEEVSRIINVDLNMLLDEYKAVHQQKGNVEYPYATLLLPSVKTAFPKYNRKKRMEALDPAFHRFNSVRKQKLQLFPMVEETLEKLAKQGVHIVGYTDSAKENGYARLRMLGVEKYFTRVYVSKSQYRNRRHLSLPEKVKTVSGKKPNPSLLKHICEDQGVSLDEAVYIGDSLTKDIYMAERAGVYSILIKGDLKGIDMHEYYNKLVAISHWLPEDFDRETALKAECIEKGIKPDAIISCFGDVADIIEKLNSEA